MPFRPVKGLTGWRMLLQLQAMFATLPTSSAFTLHQGDGCKSLVSCCKALFSQSPSPPPTSEPSSLWVLGFGSSLTLLWEALRRMRERKHFADWSFRLSGRGTDGN